MLLLSVVVRMVLLCASASASNFISWHTVVVKTPDSVFHQQVDYDEFEDSINVTVPSAYAGMVHEHFN